MVIFNVFDKILASPPVNITFNFSYLEFILLINPVISLDTPPIIPACIEALVELPGKSKLFSFFSIGRFAV